MSRSKSRILYEEIVNSIISDIENGTFKSGSRLPTEKAMCEQFGVSRVTIRKAIDVLCERRYLRRMPNQGVFVCAPHANLGGQFMKSTRQFMFQHLKGQGLDPSSKILLMEIIPAGETIGQKLKCDPSANVYKIKRVIYLNDVIFLLQETYLLEKFFPEFNPWSLQNDDLGTIIERDYHYEVGNIRLAISVKEPPASLSDLAGWNDHEPLLYENTVAAFKSGEIYEYHESYINTSVAEYVFEWSM